VCECLFHTLRLLDCCVFQLLDDNKKLCLVSGEIITLTPQVEIMFEVDDLSTASPATVSRCGMVFVDGATVSTSAVVDSWLTSLPSCLPPAVRPMLKV
jgi:dynein heavy chain, axonemal